VLATGTKTGDRHPGEGTTSMETSVNAGARLDRLPIGAFHYRIFWLVGAGARSKR
jgi:hypothetical protein